jgi:hypothetical protein
VGKLPVGKAFLNLNLALNRNPPCQKSMPPSSSHPEAMPEIPRLRLLTQSLAMLDAIICPEWDSLGQKHLRTRHHQHACQQSA